MPRVLAVMAIWPLATMAHASPVLPPIWSDGAVVQADRPILLWGKAAPGEALTVTLGERRGRGVADKDGRWKIALAPLPAQATAMTLTVTSADGVRAVANDIVVGEVWLAAGQSNMEFPIEYADEGYDAFIEINAPQIRFFVVEKHQSLTPQEEARGVWVKLTPRSAPKVSAVGFFFARELMMRTGRPVGVVQASYGGTPIEAWTPRETIEAGDYDSDARSAWQDALDREIKERRDAAALLKARWEAALPGMRGEELMAFSPGEWPAQTSTARMATVLYNGMLHPLLPYAMRGMLWYQGETNRPDGARYRSKLAAFLNALDQRWGGHRPVGIVQTAPYAWPVGGDPQDVPLQWQGQAEVAASRPNTGLIPTLDIADRRDIHPRRKRFVGERLAWWATNRVYGLDAPAYTGPMLRSISRVDVGYRITFDHASGLRNRAGGAAVAIELQGVDGIWQPAEAAVDGDGLIVDDRTAPGAIRYQWRRDAQPDLVNAAGVPAWPFQSKLP
ncbi:sialate O-acetylesterase [Sphingobium algorifonticola]|uniref:Sialate O-acetylesterase domain-containing protein n=1 Tax=Sphingobium algorifonticola TaxID=2008318 RepID=A0A437JA98_9SPHN|nr:sialate O-acetylesterase [Sphingobium algorifonticola]RVT42290.1 hypothetical protein ENE74_08820 [Sphingobium algorifonticola]